MKNLFPIIVNQLSNWHSPPVTTDDGLIPNSSHIICFPRKARTNPGDECSALTSIMMRINIKISIPFKRHYEAERWHGPAKFINFISFISSHFTLSSPCRPWDEWNLPLVNKQTNDVPFVTPDPGTPLGTQMGKLMAASHNSLRDDFEVSCHEVDILVEATLGAPGVLGTRMTGGGFGGCTVTLVQKESVEAAVKTIDTIYSRKVGGKFKARFFLAEPAEGARVINLRAY